MILFFIYFQKLKLILKWMIFSQKLKLIVIGYPTAPFLLPVKFRPDDCDDDGDDNDDGNGDYDADDDRDE